MLCQKCGKDFSVSVFMLHVNRCQGDQPPEEIDQARELILAELEEKQIKFDRRLSNKNLLKLLGKGEV